MRYLFLSAAWVNWLGGLGIIFLLEPLWGLVGITPLPQEPVYMDLFGLLVVMFGLGYYWASRDFEANQSIIHLGALAKLMVVVVSVVEVLLGNISWQILILFSIDLVYGILFFVALQQLKKDDAYSHSS